MNAVTNTPAELTDEQTSYRLAELLLSIGWASPCDAQWSRLNNALPEICDILQHTAAPVQQDPVTFPLPKIGALRPNLQTGMIEHRPIEYRHSLERYARQAVIAFVESSAAAPAQSVQPKEATMICQQCGADRFKEDCKGNRQSCAIQGVAQASQAAPSVPEGWIVAVNAAEQSAMRVFENSCNHTEQAIQYMQQLMLAAAPEQSAQPKEDKWHEAVLHECIKVESCYVEGDPTKTLNNLIDWYASQAAPSVPEGIEQAVLAAFEILSQDLDVIAAHHVKHYAPTIARQVAIDAECAAAPAAQAPVTAGEQKPTDISMRLREYASNPGYSHNDYADTMRAAANEIERYYGGMLAWKKTAETKDRQFREEVTARVDDRIAARNAATSAAQAPTGFDAEFLSKRLARVAKLVGYPMPDMTHEGIAEVAGTILGAIAGMMERAAQAPDAKDAERLDWLQANPGFKIEKYITWRNGEDEYDGIERCYWKVITNDDDEFKGSTIRDAIDAAMQENGNG